MFFHCNPYKCNTLGLLTAVLTILLGATCASAESGSYAATKPRIALLGDSMTWIGGDSCQNNTGWSHVLRESGLASDIDVYARSGATWTNTRNTRRNPTHYTELLHDDNVVFNQAVRLIERADTADCAPDIIILFAGANDAWFASRRPGIFDRNNDEALSSSSTDPAGTTSLEGSLRLVTDLLHSRFPDATLLFVAPLQMAKTDAETIHLVADIIENTASKKGWITLRADKDLPVTHRQETKSHRFTYDGVHTNPDGARITGNYITHHILTSYPTPKTQHD